jgi:SAM-dependent methyltransferase
MSTAPRHEANAAQADYWNGTGGRHWTERQELQDAVLAPVSDVLFARADIAAGERVVDIGCGCGATVLDILTRVGPSGRVLGLDVSTTMLERAKERTQPGAPASFIAGDATIHPFEPESFDLLFSRFGVMFFADPALAFANIRKGLRKGGRLIFACWREPRQNPWIMLPLQAAYKFAPRLPEVGPEDPGAFSFASEARVHRVLGRGGFSDVAMAPVDLSLDVAVGRGLDAAVESVVEIGPVSRALDNQPQDVRAAAAGAIRTALEPYLKGGEVRLGGAIWIVTAQNP